MSVFLLGYFPRFSGERQRSISVVWRPQIFSFFLDYARFSLKNAVFNAQLGEGLDLTVHRTLMTVLRIARFSSEGIERFPSHIKGHFPD